MLHPKQLHPYQVQAINHVVQCPYAMLNLDMGLGKTIITYTAFLWLKECDLVRSILVVAPRRPARLVWEKEARKWEHTKNLRFSYIMGTAQERLDALFRKADVYVINYENLAWLKVQLEGYIIGRGRYPPWQMVVWDEVTKMKNATTLRVTEFTAVMPYIARRVGLTGTPASNGLQDLHGQYLMVDDGHRLGVRPAAFMKRFFYTDEYSKKLRPYAGTPERLAEMVADITLEMRNEDYLQMPELVINDIWIDLPPKAREIYDTVEEEFFVELDSGVEINAANEASKMNKCLQIADGGVYIVPGEPGYEPIHTAKLEAWEELREEIGDSPLLSAYRFVFTYHMLRQRVDDLENLTGASDKEAARIEMQFNQGVVRNVIGHPASTGHGLNLQEACNHVCMIACPWSLDQYQQFFSRVRRQGQKQPRVILHRILARDTFDEVVIESLAHKDQSQETHRDLVQQYRQRRYSNVTQHDTSDSGRLFDGGFA